MDNRSQAATAARYQRGDVLRVPLGARLELFYCRRTQRAVVAPAIHADALGSCNGFRTLTERALTSSAPHGATGALLGGPRSRAKASGFAARVLDLLRRAGGGTPERNPAVIPALAGLSLVRQQNRPLGVSFRHFDHAAIYEHADQSAGARKHPGSELHFQALNVVPAHGLWNLDELAEPRSTLAR